MSVVYATDRQHGDGQDAELIRRLGQWRETGALKAPVSLRGLVNRFHLRLTFYARRAVGTSALIARGSLGLPETPQEWFNPKEQKFD